MGRLGLLFLLTIVSPLIFGRGVRAGLCSALISPNGYPCTEYTVTTQDGFILGLQNIPAQSGATPVLLVHGLLSGGDCWFLNSPGQSLALMLSDAGYDVWIGNNRCNQWSSGHTSFTPSSNEYWAWSYDELSSYDLSTMTEFVYNQRGKLFYVGHSQGSLMLFAGLTGGLFKSEVLGYLQGAVLLAPVTSVGHLTPLVLRAGLTIYIDEILPALGIQQFDASIFANFACTNLSLSASTCDTILSDLINAFSGPNNYLDSTKLPFYNKYFPESTSSNNIDHFGQSYRSDSFSFYNKGLSGNLASYGSSSPPLYDLSTFPSSLPVQIWSGGVDGLADPTDVANLLAQLPSSNRETFYLSSYGHIDFVLGSQAHSDVYLGVMEFIHTHAY